jgi:hypothetical protein
MTLVDRWSSCRAAEIVFWIAVSAGSADAFFGVYSGTQGIYTEKRRIWESAVQILIAVISGWLHRICRCEKVDSFRLT